MAGNTFQDLFQGQMDFIFFFKGLAFILVLAVSCLFRGDDSQRLPWRWFGLFALLQGLAAWLSLVAMNLGDASSLRAIGYFLQIASWVSLAEFGRSGIGRIQGRDSGLWLIALLLMLTSLGGLKGWSGIEQASRYTLGLAGGLWAATALFMAGRRLPSRERGGSLTASISLGIFSLTIALFPPLSMVSPGSFLNQESFQRFTGVPLEFLQALLAFGMAAGIYGLLAWRQKMAESQEARHRSRSMFVLLATLSIILGLGSVLTLYLGEWAQKKQEKTKSEAHEYASIVVSRLNTEFRRMEDGVTALAETNWLPFSLQNLTEDNLEKINELLDRYRGTLDTAVCYLMDKNGKTIASSNRSAPDSFVGQSYAFRPYFKQAIKGITGRYFAVGVTSKAPGYYVSRPVRAPRGKANLGVAVVKVSLQNVTQELQAAGQKGNSLICLADPRGVVFLASQPEMLLKSLWPVAANDLVNLQEQYGKDQFPAIFPEKLADGSKVDYQGRNYMASFAGTIHAGWSVFFFRPVEMVGAYRLAGIGVACILAILALVILGRNFYSKDHALASAGRFRAMFDAAPEAIGVIDPDALKIVEANRSLATCLGYTQKELLTLNLGKLLNHDSQEILPWLLKIIQDDGAAKIAWYARKKDGSIVELEVMGSKLEHQGRDQVLIFCRVQEALPPPPTAIFQEAGQISPVQDPRITSLLAGSDFKEPHEAIKNILSHPKENRPDENVEDFDHETKVLINRIRTALNKAEKLRKNSGDRQNL
jgi:PAS domain S-box-containing protein